MAWPDHEGGLNLVARIRTIKPEILEDEKTSLLSDTAFRLFISMISLADDHGNVRMDVRWLTAQIWWAHGSKPNVLGALAELSCAGLIIAYEVRRGTYAAIVGWQKHQRIDNAGKGRVPPPDDPDSQLVKVDEHGLRVDEHGELSQSRRLAATRGEIPLDPDQDPDQDPDRDREREPAAKPPRRPLKPFKLSGSLPEGWEPAETDVARATNMGLDVRHELDKFRNHHASKGSKRADWDAAFRSWVDRAQDFARPERSASESSQASNNRDL